MEPNKANQWVEKVEGKVLMGCSSYAKNGADFDKDPEMAMTTLGCLLQNVVHVKYKCAIFVLPVTWLNLEVVCWAQRENL